MNAYLNKSTLLFLLALTGCTHSISKIDSTGKTAAPAFPEISSAIRSEGSYVSLEDISKVKAGMTKANIYEIIGVPHFKEGVFGVKEWDYILHFKNERDQDITCQYKVTFDKGLKVGGTYFKPENCLSLLKSTPEKRAYSKDISAEMLFAFASDRLNADGVAHIQRVAQELKALNLEGRTITITGHTDRIGNASDNYHLSLQRANSVKDLLGQYGISTHVMRVKGMGASMPRVLCPGVTSTAVVNCLAPNRRITIEVN